ncbi:hypothetical protein C900_02200 [Fulvivirga imtechensis AK7]|uniref:DUF1573 domain-containing protein n=1 Tax=Fulvivirga imtechensis AK7 TaxID=1237149 RepID=L8JSK6_9BACT|nr:DUF1573 domain-containing protein [Fulvivirga imtechensis]ELR71825.1 hypothetical protein C900_02200 [Fulvivirga imtechensis AK7]
MKTFVVFIFGVFMIYNALAQESATVAENGPVMTFDTAKHDFGDIHQGDKVQHTFTFENTGNEPLIITNVQVTCGCTASDWPRDPIAPGQESSITISFNSAGKLGMQNKVITIVSNAANPNNRLTIITNVLPKKDDAGR